MCDFAPLLTIPNHHPAQGSLPRIFPEQYLGYYDSGFRQLVFVFVRELWYAKVYVSSLSWDRCHEVRDGQLPASLILAADEIAWLKSCWDSAILRFKRSAIENQLDRQLWGREIPAR